MTTGDGGALMDVLPGARGTDRVWNHVEAGFAALALRSGDVRGHGGGADPLVLFHRPRGRGVAAVFDVGERQAPDVPARLRALLEEGFTTGGRTEPAPESLTTFAGITFDLAGSEVSWTVHQAGDARCYAAEPRSGLRPVSGGGPNGSVQVSTWTGHETSPCVLVCVSKGFFVAGGTPPGFERLLWETLLSAQDILHWSGLLADRTRSFAGSGASVVVVALGFEDFAALRASFRERADFLNPVPEQGRA
ncbi:hypothetical protein [Amycolatopsis sp. lyj-90]|uniref:hypothetical protein n=1 Tax=Amycolatopsis sp. lyj-90 TaxID=2789285 RepID=UPI00397D1D2B